MFINYLPTMKALGFLMEKDSILGQKLVILTDSKEKEIFIIIGSLGIV